MEYRDLMKDRQPSPTHFANCYREVLRLSDSIRDIADRMRTVFEGNQNLPPSEPGQMPNFAEDLLKVFHEAQRIEVNCAQPGGDYLMDSLRESVPSSLGACGMSYQAVVAKDGLGWIVEQATHLHGCATYCRVDVRKALKKMLRKLAFDGQTARRHGFRDPLGGWAVQLNNLAMNLDRLSILGQLHEEAAPPFVRHLVDITSERCDLPFVVTK